MSSKTIPKNIYQLSVAYRLFFLFAIMTGALSSAQANSALPEPTAEPTLTRSADDKREAVILAINTLTYRDELYESITGLKPSDAIFPAIKQALGNLYRNPDMINLILDEKSTSSEALSNRLKAMYADGLLRIDDAVALTILETFATALSRMDDATCKAYKADKLRAKHFAMLAKLRDSEINRYIDTIRLVTLASSKQTPMRPVLTEKQVNSLLTTFDNIAAEKQNKSDLNICQREAQTFDFIKKLDSEQRSQTLTLILGIINGKLLKKANPQSESNPNAAYIKNEVDSGNSTYYSMQEVDTRPVLIHKIDPTYPSDLVDKSITAEVNVLFYLNENGKIHTSTILSATPAGKGFEDAVEKAIGTAEFRPAYLNGKAVKSKVIYKIKISPQSTSHTNNPIKPSSKRTIFTTSGIEKSELKAYVDKSLSKIEKIGNSNYPKAASEAHLYGTAIVTIFINSDGSLNKIDIDRSSGHKLLDDSLIDMINKSTPFEPIPSAVRLDFDIVAITRSFTFERKSKIGDTDGVDKHD